MLSICQSIYASIRYIVVMMRISSHVYIVFVCLCAIECRFRKLYAKNLWVALDVAEAASWIEWVGGWVSEWLSEWQVYSCYDSEWVIDSDRYLYIYIYMYLQWVIDSEWLIVSECYCFILLCTSISVSICPYLSIQLPARLSLEKHARMHTDVLTHLAGVHPWWHL